MTRRTTKLTLDPSLAVAYCRVSTNRQPFGRDAQAHAIKTWAAIQKIEVLATFVDEGVSGAAPLHRRPGMINALAALRELGAGALLVSRRDRLARDPIIAALIQREVERLGARVVGADDLGNGTEPGDQLVRRVLDAVAEYERGMIAVRTRQALERKRRRGEFCGGRSAPYGFRLGPDGRTLEPNPIEREAIQLARELRAAGLSLRAIGVELLRCGHRPKRAPAWSAKTVLNLIQSSAA